MGIFFIDSAVSQRYSLIQNFVNLDRRKKSKAYIPLRCITIGIGSWRWLTPPMPYFRLGDTNMLVSENAKTPDAKPKICVLPDAKPKRKPVEYRLRWVPTQNSGVGHVHFMFFVLISLATQREPSSQWNMGLKGTRGG